MNYSALKARQTIDNSYSALDDGGGDTGTGGTGNGSGNSGTPDTGSGGGWNWGAAWNAVSHMFDSAVGVWGRPKYSNYPSQDTTPSPISPLVTYGILAVVVLLALALMVKILK